MDMFILETRLFFCSGIIEQLVFFPLTLAPHTAPSSLLSFRCCVFKLKSRP